MMYASHLLLSLAYYFLSNVFSEASDKPQPLPNILLSFIPMFVSNMFMALEGFD